MSGKGDETSAKSAHAKACADRLAPNNADGERE